MKSGPSALVHTEDRKAISVELMELDYHDNNGDLLALFWINGGLPEACFWSE
ncbi:hypothetical protein U2F10_02810 [Leptothoe sp. EHU-05/26/07-4]